MGKKSWKARSEGAVMTSGKEQKQRRKGVGLKKRPRILTDHELWRTGKPQ